MNNESKTPQNEALSRRSFLKHSSLAVAGTTVAANFPFVVTSHAAPDDPINVGLVGCGGRGKGAAINAKGAASGVKIVALADIFEDEVKKARNDFPEVPAEKCFSGWDCYQKVLAIPEVNYVILATPPGFRPVQFKAAVAAGKHVFMEKPVAVDAPGVREILAAGEIAKQKNLCVVAGTQRRHQPSYIETIKRIQDGGLGEVLYLRAFWNQGSIWHRGYDSAKPEMENEIRNWYHYRWLSGDHIVEQHLHNIDVCNWAMGNAHPVKAYGMGGRQALGDKPGHIWDHFAVEFEYENGARMFSQCRQISGCDGLVKEFAHGTKGESNCENYIKGKENRWRFPGRPSDAYTIEHTDLINAIRSGKNINESQVVAESTLTAIMGRESAYTGQNVDWETMVAAKTVLMPAKLEWNVTLPKWEVPIPGLYKLV
jgi:predicted dehydrogenase